MAYSTPLVLVMVRMMVVNFQSFAGLLKARIVAGREAMDCAKMMGITPDMFTLMGRNVLWPPYIFRPRICLAY